MQITVFAIPEGMRVVRTMAAVWAENMSTDEA